MGWTNPDLEKKLRNAQDAREFIATCDEHFAPCPKPPHIFYDLDRVIPLDNSKISDEDAITAALEILHSVVVPEAWRQSQFQRWHH